MALPNVRQAVVAGKFYPAAADKIIRELESFLEPGVKKKEVIGCMLPHAGYVYSGRVATQTLSSIDIKDKIILLGPNHTGNGAAYSIMARGRWRTPLGDIDIDEKLAADLIKHSKYLEDDSSAHLYEHSLEVELPILQYFKKDFQIVPIAFMSDDLETLKRIGEELANVIKNSGLKDKVLLVASSDMTHYEPEADARKKDEVAIDAILEINPDKLMSEVRRIDISMCGYAPVTVLLSAANSLGAKEAKLIKYQTSADATGDKSAVVGYAGIIIS